MNAVESMTWMSIRGLKHRMRIVGLADVLRLSPDEQAGWHILSIRGRMHDDPLDFPGAWSTKTVHFNDVLADSPEHEEFAATPKDIQAVLDYSRGIVGQPLLIHCAAGISRSTAVAWIILYDRLKDEPNAVQRSFEIVRDLRPILSPNRHVLRLGVEALVGAKDRDAIMAKFIECLV